MNAPARRIALCGALMLLTAAARADTMLSVPTVSGADVSIRLSSPCPETPRFGFMPVRVTIANSATEDRSWRFQFEAGTRARLPGVVITNRVISIPAGQTRDTWVYVPLAEPGELAPAPQVGPNGVTPSVALGASGNVVITKTAVGTKVTRFTPGLGPAAREEIEINETTGEVVRTHYGTGGAQTASFTNRPPPGLDVTYTIDPALGTVMTSYAGHGTKSGPVKVTVIQRPGGAVPTSPFAGTTKVTIAKSTLGTKVTRTNTLPSGRPMVEEQEIDEKTGVIATTIVTSSGHLMPVRTTPGPAVGQDATYTISPVTGFIRRSYTNAADPKAAPKITVVTGPSGPPSGVYRRPVMSTYSGPPMSLAVLVIGPGVVGNSRVQFPLLSGDANMRPLAASSAIARVLDDALKSEGVTTPNLATVDPAELPADWRAWAGFSTVVLTADEFDALDAARHAALRGWVALGGRLCLEPVEACDAVVEKFGAGEIAHIARPLKSDMTAVELNDLGISLAGHVGHPDHKQLEVQEKTPLGSAVELAEPNSLWIGVFLVGFAIVIGPVNVYALAPANRRHRLFFTTPLISFGAVAILGATIFLHDGVGGTGWRRALVVLVPHDNQAAVFQEQGSRSGFLTSQSFPLPDDLQMTVLPLPGAGWNPFAAGNGVDLQRTDGRGAGGWFRSRSPQAQLLQRLTPTRARVERVGTADGGAPIVESTFGGVLRDFAWVDEQGAVWGAALVEPGRPTTLARNTLWLDDRALGATPRFTDLVHAAVRQEPNHWCATVDRLDLAPIPTLASIRWNDAPVIVTGLLESRAVQKEAKP